MRKRIISTLMALCMALTLLPVQVLAANYTVGEDAGVSARALAGTAGTKLKADNIDAYVANGLGSGVYTLAEDVTISGTLRVTGDATVDLNGHVLRFDQSAQPDSIFRVTSGSTLTLTDSAPTATHSDASLPAGGLITGGKGFKYDNGAGQSYNYYGGGVYVETGASFVLAGGTIYACGVQSGANQAFGGGIYAEGGSVTMTGGAIRNCAVSADYSASGGAIYAKAGSVTMTSGVISGCSAMYGGGISASGCTVQITGGRIENCKASEHSGGLYIGGHADQISVLDAAISGCEAKRGGGVALIAFAELELGENARITGCTATEKDDTEAGAIEYGAAIYMDLDSTYTVNYPGCFLYANGGRVEGTVYVGTNKIGTKNNYLDSVKATNAIDHTDGKPTTVFTGDVYCAGDIRGGSFYGSVTAPDSADSMGTVWKKFCSNISGGTFYGPVTTECHVSGGTFYGGLTMEKNAKLSGKPIQTTGTLGMTTNIPDPNGTPVTVTYDYGERGGIYAKQIVQAGEKAIQPDVPSRQGYQFTDWYLDDTKYDFNTAVTGDMTLTAKWTVCDHKGSTAQATCTTPAICTACGGTLAALGHEWGPWTSGSDNTHTRACKRDGTHTETKDCSGGTATCTAKAVCTVCGGEYGEMAAHSFTAEKAEAQYLKSAATCTEKAIYYKSCAVCGLSSEGTADEATFFSGNALGHTWGAWRSNGSGTHTRRCGTDGCTGTETKDCSGGTATCTAKAVCTVCGGEYGEMAAHSFTAEKAEAQYLKSAATCTEKAIYYKSCAVCGLSSEGTADEATFFSGNALGHTWGAWTSNGNGTHTRRCGTDGCTHTETKDCSGGTAICTAKAVCSVCGKSYGAVDTANHDLKHTAAKEPGAFVTGRIEYWTCRTCGKYFADAGGAKEISRDDIIIPRLGTAADSAGGKASPATFDAGIGAGAVTAVTSLAGLVLLRRKRRDGE